MEQHFEDLGKDLISLNKELKSIKQADHTEQDNLNGSIENEEKFVDELDSNLRTEEVGAGRGSARHARTKTPSCKRKT